MATKILFILALIHLSWACRSSVDPEREPILSHHGTEPPEPQHKKPKEEAPKEASEEAKHEEGEIEVRPNVWEFPVAQTKKGMLWGTIGNVQLFLILYARWLHFI